nr:hypothetical protein [Streptomyces misionensis]
MPATWSLTASSQVMPRLNPKYFGDGAAFTSRSGRSIFGSIFSTRLRSQVRDFGSPSAPSLSTVSFVRPSS